MINANWTMKRTGSMKPNNICKINSDVIHNNSCLCVCMHKVCAAERIFENSKFTQIVITINILRSRWKDNETQSNTRQSDKLYSDDVQIQIKHHCECKR